MIYIFLQLTFVLRTQQKREKRELFFSFLETIRVSIHLNNHYCFPIVDFRYEKLTLCLWFQFLHLWFLLCPCSGSQSSQDKTGDTLYYKMGNLLVFIQQATCDLLQQDIMVLQSNCNKVAFSGFNLIFWQIHIIEAASLPWPPILLHYFGG